MCAPRDACTRPRVAGMTVRSFHPGLVSFCSCAGHASTSCWQLHPDPPGPLAVSGAVTQSIQPKGWTVSHPFNLISSSCLGWLRSYVCAFFLLVWNRCPGLQGEGARTRLTSQTLVMVTRMWCVRPALNLKLILAHRRRACGYVRVFYCWISPCQSRSYGSRAPAPSRGFFP